MKYPIGLRQIDRPYRHSPRERNGCMDSEGTCKHPLWFRDGSLDLDGHFLTVNSSHNNNKLLCLYLRLHLRDLSGLMDIRDNKMHLRVRPRLSPMEQNRCINSSSLKYKHGLCLRNGNKSLSRQMESGDNRRLVLFPRDKHKNHPPFRHNLKDLNWRLTKPRHLNQSLQDSSAQLEARAQSLCLTCKLQLQHTPSSPEIPLSRHDMMFNHAMLPMLLVGLQL
jgi:hypothetical protein